MKIVNCDRCGKPCQAAGPLNQDARPFRRAHEGLCTECVVVDFLKGLNPAREAVEKFGADRVFKDRHFQKIFAAALKSGGSDLSAKNINWEGVIERWN